MNARSIRMRVLLGVLVAALAVTLALGGSRFATARSARTVPQATLAAVVAEPLASPPAGSSHADVTIVEYFDYNCPVCRELDPQLRKLVATDSKVRIIHKDWPVFGDGSVYAAYCSFAAARLGRYSQAHDALISSKDDLDSKEDVRKVLRAAGFDTRVLDADIAKHKKEYGAVIARNARETGELGIEGTPGLVVGDRVVLKHVDYGVLVGMVGEVRAGRGGATGDRAR